MVSSIRHILVVEDHADSALMLTRLLKRAGYVVDAATCVEDAVTLAKNEEVAGTPFHLVLSDVGLPDATGYDLMRRLLENHRLKGIALSGYGQSDDVRKALDAGFSYHLTKPIDFDRLQEMIRGLFERELSTSSSC